MIKRAILIALICVCVGALTSAVLATPSTLIWIPSTDIQAAKQTHFGFDAYIPSNSEGSTLTDAGLTWGNGKNLEYGVDYLSQDGLKDPFRLNAKYMIVDEKKTSPKWVIGAFDFGGDAASNQVYLLGSKTFPEARLTFGYAVGKKSALVKDENMLLLGVDKQFNPKWWGGVDFQSGKSSFGALNAGVAYSFTPKTSLIVGYDWYLSGAPNTVTLQLDMNL